MAILNSLLVLAASSPYGGPRANAGLDVALTAAAFELKVTVVFLDAGVLQLVAGQDSGDSGRKNIGKMISALRLYDVQDVYVHDESASLYGVETGVLVDDAIAGIDDAALRDLMQSAAQVLVF